MRAYVLKECAWEAASRAAGMSRRSWLLALGMLLVVATALFGVPGYLTWDSGTYHLMVRTLYRTGGFFIPNGYEELSSPLLAVGHTEVRNGHLVSQYPEYYTFLALPFYALFGYRGFMVLNALAFVGTCALLWRMARWFSDDEDAPLAAVLVYALCTYAVVYTQTSYPHSTSVFLVCLATWLLWGPVLGRDDMPGLVPKALGTPSSRCALAGAVLGLAIGVRLDSAFAGLALAVPLASFRRLGWRHWMAGGLGALPPLLGLAWINLVKFGVFSPFSYGRTGSSYTASLVPYLPVAAAFAVGLALLLWHRHRPIPVSRRHASLMLLIVPAALLLTPEGQRFVHGAFQILVDMRIRPDIPEPALSRSPDGAVVYWGHVKKALLESCPYLVLIVLPALRGAMSGSYGIRWLLWLVPVGYVAVYGYLAWHGSLTWNMRYLNPALPFLAMLASHEILRVKECIPWRKAMFWSAVAVLWLVLAAAMLLTNGSLAHQELLILDGGLGLAALLLTIQAFATFGPLRASSVSRGALGALLMISLVWSSALAVGVDYVIGNALRSKYLDISRAIKPNITEKSLIVAFQPNCIWGLLDTDRQPFIADYNIGSIEDSIDIIKKTIDKTSLYWIAGSYGVDYFTELVFNRIRENGFITKEISGGVSTDRYKIFVIYRGWPEKN